MKGFCVVFCVVYSIVNCLNVLITSVGGRKSIFLLFITSNFVVSFRKGFLFVLIKDCLIFMMALLVRTSQVTFFSCGILVGIVNIGAAI